MCICLKKIHRRISYFCRYGKDFEVEREKWVKRSTEDLEEKIKLTENSPLVIASNPPLEDIDLSI